MNKIEISEDWHVESLGNITKKIMKGIFDLSPLHYVQNGVPFLRISNIQNNCLDLSSVKFITKEKNDEFPSTQLNPGDIVLAKVGGSSGGKVAIIPTSISVCNISQNLIGIKPNIEKINSKFLFYFLQNKKITDSLLSKATGTSQKMIRLKVMQSMHIPLPKLIIQQKIVQKLDYIIAQIDEKKKIILELQQRKINHIKNLESNLRIDLIKKNISLRNTPSHWHIKKLSEIAEIGQGGTPSRIKPEYWNGTIPWLRSGEILNNRITDSREKITELGLKKSSTQLCPKGTILMAMTGQGLTRGRTALLEIEACANQSCAHIINKSEEVLTEFLWLFLQSQYWFIRFIHHGSGQPGINTTLIKQLEIVIPPLNGTKEILRKIKESELHLQIIKSKLNSILESEELLTKHLDYLKTSILEKAFSGKLVN